MTIHGIRQFLKKYRKLLEKQGVLYKGKFFAKHTILDVAGYLHTNICARGVTTLESLTRRVSAFINAILKEIKDDWTLYIVFDPLEYVTDGSNEYAKLKLETIGKRNETKSMPNGLNIHQITELKKNMYFFIKEQYSQNTKVKILVSTIEADIMIGSLICQIEDENENLKKDDLTVISTDCDMFVTGYGYKIQDYFDVTDTVKFFQLFGLIGKRIVCHVPKYLGCDYNPGTNRLIETIYNQMTFEEDLIFNVFYRPYLVETNFNLVYEKKDWVEQCNKIYGEGELEDLPSLNEVGNEVETEKTEGERNENETEKTEGERNEVETEIENENEVENCQ